MQVNLTHYHVAQEPTTINKLQIVSTPFSWVKTVSEWRGLADQIRKGNTREPNLQVRYHPKRMPLGEYVPLRPIDKVT